MLNISETTRDRAIVRGDQGWLKQGQVETSCLFLLTYKHRNRDLVMSLLSLHVNVLWSTRFTEAVLVSITTSTRLLDIVSNFYDFEKFRHCCVTITFTIYSWMHCCSINLADFTSIACFRKSDVPIRYLCCNYNGYRMGHVETLLFQPTPMVFQLNPYDLYINGIN